MNINPIIFELFQKLDKNENGYQNNLYSAKCCFKKPKNKENIYKVKSAEKEIRYIKIFHFKYFVLHETLFRKERNVLCLMKLTIEMLQNISYFLI